jgi:hypothetical protein
MFFLADVDILNREPWIMSVLCEHTLNALPNVYCDRLKYLKYPLVQGRAITSVHLPRHFKGLPEEVSNRGRDFPHTLSHPACPLQGGRGCKSTNPTRSVFAVRFRRHKHEFFRNHSSCYRFIIFRCNVARIVFAIV